MLDVGCWMFPFLAMRFYVRKRRTTPAVIIVALIDVLIVLVIFLLVTTMFKQQQYMVKLAASSQAQKTGANENPPLLVSIDEKSVLRFGPNNDVVTADQLAIKLRDAVARNPDVTLAINADVKAPWGTVVKVRDDAAEAKIKSLIAYTTRQTAKP